MVAGPLVSNTIGAIALVGSLCLATAASSFPAWQDFEPGSIQVAGQQRTYLVSRTKASGPLPTIVLLHGLGGSAEKLSQSGAGLAALGARDGFVTVLPNALGVWNAFPQGTHYPTRGYGSYVRSGEDVAFLKQLVADLVARRIADPSRVYLAGISFGGHMTLWMACVAPQQFAALGVVISSMPEPDAPDCHPSKPLPLVMINGTDDPVVPFAGGMTSGGFRVWSRDHTLTFFRKINGCDGAAQHSVIPESDWNERLTVDRWTNCSGAPVTAYSAIGGVHEVPGGLRAMADGFSSAQALWDFFRDKKANID